MGITISDIAAALDAELFGDGAITITGASEPTSAGTDDLALAMSETYAKGLADGHARAAILWDGADWQALGLEAAIVVPRPRYAMSGITALLDPGPEIAPGIHPSAVIDPSARVGDGAAIGPLVVIGPRARIGARARIAPHVSIAEEASLGEDALLHAGARIGARVQIGDRFIAHSGAMIGADGFAFVTPETSRVEEARKSLGTSTKAENSSWTRIHSLGTVEIGDDVEIGANTTIDRGTIRATRIGHRTKLDNLVHIGHNVEIGEDTLICGQVGIAGSTRIGARVVLGGQVGVSDNIFVGDDVVAGGGTDIYTNVPAGRTILGSPAVKMETELEIRRNLRRLPRLAADIKALKKAVSKDANED